MEVFRGTGAQATCGAPVPDGRGWGRARGHDISYSLKFGVRKERMHILSTSVGGQMPHTHELEG